MKATIRGCLRASLAVRVHLRMLLSVCMVTGLGALAGTAGAASIQDRPEVNRFIAAMVERHDFDRSALERLFAAATPRPEIIAAMEQPREALPWYEYRRGFVTEERITLGARYWREHRAALERAEREYGVPPELIVAIIGVETRYGAHQGSYPVLDALITGAFDYPRRGDFFRTELEEFLLLARELRLDADAIKGSYAGALGIPQFIPSSYRRYAVDFDNDGRRDLFESNDDAIGSVANFLSQHGWAAGQPVIDVARIKKPLGGWPKQLGDEPVLTVREWIGYGVVPRRTRTMASAARPDAEQAAGLIALEGESGALYHLGYNNFYVITRYNRSRNYAMAAYELARMILLRYQAKS